MRPILLPAALLAASLAPAATATPTWSDPVVAGIVTDARLAETSGIAPAHARPGTWWVLNDGGNAPALHWIDAGARRLASVRVDGLVNTDWEDLAAFTLEGRRYLLVADTGDNGGLRTELRLSVIEEPTEVRDGMAVPVAWSLRFRWPDGPRDCEAVAVDASRGEILLVSKKRVPPELFRLPLRPASPDVLTAQRIGRLRGIAQPTAEDLRRNPVYGRYRSQVTGASLSPDGRTLAVLNYRALYLFERGPDEPWPESGRPAARLMLPWMPQAEAVSFSIDGRALVVAGEQTPGPLLRFDAR